MADLSQIATSTRDSIGRYFSLVSALPSAILVAWAVLLVESGAWSGRPDPVAAVRGFAGLGISGVAGLGLASLVLGIVLHPVQFAFVQFLEGYWGVSPLGRRLRLVRIRHHWERLDELRAESDRLAEQISRLADRRAMMAPPQSGRVDRLLVDLRATKQEVDRVVSMSPANRPGAVMPTRLGNILRYYEWNVGRAYGINTVITVPFLSRAAAPGDMEYVNDQRSQLDLAVRMVIVSFIATGLGVLFLARHGLWLLVALVPYTAAYVTYRGAVVAAGEYGRALGVLVTLNRVELYDRLRLEPLADTDEERGRNVDLMLFLEHKAVARRSLKYREEPPPVAQGGA